MGTERLSPQSVLPCPDAGPVGGCWARIAMSGVNLVCVHRDIPNLQGWVLACVCVCVSLCESMNRNMNLNVCLDDSMSLNICAHQSRIMS